MSSNNAVAATIAAISPTPQQRRSWLLLACIMSFGLVLFLLMESSTSQQSHYPFFASSPQSAAPSHAEQPPIAALRPDELNEELLNSVSRNYAASPSSAASDHSLLSSNELQRLSTKVKLHLMTFSSKKYACSLTRFKAEAKLSGLFFTISAFTEDDLTDDYLSRVNTTRHSRGFGYWSWRPYLMLKQLEHSIKPGEILVFADAGCSISPFPNSLLADVRTLLADIPAAAAAVAAADVTTSSGGDGGIKKKRKKSDADRQSQQQEQGDADWVVRRLELKHSLEKWAKGDAFSAFGVTPNSSTANNQLGPPSARLGSLPMFLGGIQVVRNTPRARRLLQAWYESMTAHDLVAVSDAKTSNDYKSPHFNEHRHDQAVLSLMLYTGRNAATGEQIDVSGVRPRADDTWVPSSGGTDTSAWRALAQSGVCILATRYKECNWQSLFDEREYRYERWARAHGWLN